MGRKRIRCDPERNVEHLVHHAVCIQRRIILFDTQRRFTCHWRPGGVRDGWIVYAGEFRSYGKLLIINAGGGYHVLLAGLSQIDVQPGQFVLGAEPVGTMSGWSQQVQPAAANSAPVLYIEFRKDGTPIDPDPWWVQGHQKVQG